MFTHADGAAAGLSALAAAVCWLACTTPAGAQARPETTGQLVEQGGGQRLELANARLALAFDPATGALVSLRNLATGDEYLKGPAAGGNLFRLWRGEEVLEAAACALTHWGFTREAGAGVLRLTLAAPDGGLGLRLEIRLPDDEPAADLTLAVTNTGTEVREIRAAFPYFTGLALGENRDTNLSVNLGMAGVAGVSAWQNAGGRYGAGGEASMQWQAVYEPSRGEGLGVIVMDPDVGEKELRRNSGGVLTVTYTLPLELAPGEERALPPVRLLVHEGDWRFVARRYAEWFGSAFQAHEAPEWLDHVESLAGDSLAQCWIPSHAQVAEAQQNPGAPGAFTSFRQFARLYLPDQFDLHEWAMYNSLNLLEQGEFPIQGIIHADGTYYPREDLGGAAALREGVAECRRLGRHTRLYVEGLIVQKNTELTLGGVAASWAIMDSPGHYLESYPYHWHMCPGSVGWQDHLASVCKRLLWETGVDGIRLDSLGFWNVPCYNPAHQHPTPNGWNSWIRVLLRKVRAAMDEVNPQAALFTEAPVDFYREFTDGAYTFNPTGAELAPMRLAVPSYRIDSYQQGQVESARNGLRLVISAAQPGGVRARFHELWPTFWEAMTRGDPTDVDPQPQGDAAWSGHLWRTPQYWLAVGGHDDASLLTGPLRVRLPELPQAVAQAWELDALTLERRDAALERTTEGVFVTVTSGFSVVLLPLPDCPPLVEVGDLPSLPAGEGAGVALTAFAPWRRGEPKPQVTVAVPGLEVSAAQPVKLPVRVGLRAPAGAEPGNYFLSVTGECLPLKRWLQVTPAGG